MKGKHKVKVYNSFVRFDFEIERNISIIRGDSATGKTTLVNMIADYQSQGTSSGVVLESSANCVAMRGLNKDNYGLFLDDISSSIVFIDEGEDYVRLKEFAKKIRKTDNYYVIVTRGDLYELPYSVDAIYEIKVSGKYGKLKTVYNRFRRIYAESVGRGIKFGVNKVVLTEDAKAGFQFFKSLCDRFGIACESAEGKSNVKSLLDKPGDESILVVADGAAFGPEMENVYSITLRRKNLRLFLPESFEWLILSSGIVEDSDIRSILSSPYDYIESSEYFSWENFFTSLLIERSRGKEYSYDKARISAYYTSDRSVKKILSNYFEDI